MATVSPSGNNAAQKVSLSVHSKTPRGGGTFDDTTALNGGIDINSKSDVAFNKLPNIRPT